MCEELNVEKECNDCQKLLCLKCSIKHSKNKGHTIIDYQKVQKCEFHIGFKKEFFCKTCLTEICKGCLNVIDGIHKSHDFVKLIDEEKSFTEKITKMNFEKKKEELRNKIIECERDLKSIEIIEDKKQPLVERYKRMVIFDPSSNKKSKEYKGIYQNEILISDLKRDGWRIIYEHDYAHPTTFDEIYFYDSSGFYCVGAYETNQDKLILCAFGDQNIFKENKLTGFCEILCNDVFWYLRKGSSFGFSDKKEISLFQADTMNGDKRLSWHLEGSGGYRIGDMINLNNSKQYNKIILYIKKLN